MHGEGKQDTVSWPAHTSTSFTYGSTLQLTDCYSLHKNRKEEVSILDTFGLVQFKFD